MAVKGKAGSIRTLPMLKSWRRYLAPSKDPFSVTMVKPGETGFGIVPWVMDACLSGCGEWHTNWGLSDGDPLLGVAFVKWTSPIGTNQEIIVDKISNYELDFVSENPSELDTPVIEIESLVYPDLNTSQPTTVIKQGIFGEDWVYSEELLVPAWCVTPVDPRLWHPWRKEMMHTWNQTPWLEAYSLLSNYDDDREYDHSDECIEDNGQFIDSKSCKCGLHTEIDQALKIIDDEVDLLEGVETNKDDFSEAVCVALDRYRDGWKLCYEQSSDGNETSDVIGHQWSPYWYEDRISRDSKKSNSDAKHSDVKTMADLPS